MNYNPPPNNYPIYPYGGNVNNMGNNNIKNSQSQFQGNFNSNQNSKINCFTNQKYADIKMDSVFNSSSINNYENNLKMQIDQLTNNAYSSFNRVNNLSNQGIFGDINLRELVDIQQKLNYNINTSNN